MEIVWLILKITGIILLSVLGIILVLLLLVLFVPIRYRAELEKKSEILIKANISWLLRMLRVDIFYEKAEKNIVVKFLWMKLYPKKEKRCKEQKSLPEVQTGAQSGAESEIHPGKQPAKQSEQQNVKQSKQQSVKQAVQQSTKKNTKKSFNIKAFKDFFQSEENILGILQALNSIKRLLKHVLPGKISGYVRFGTGDPCSTGQILGLLAAFYGYYGRTLTIQPEFLEKCLETEVKIKGRVRIFTLLTVLLGLWFDKKFKLLIANFKKLKAEISA